MSARQSALRAAVASSGEMYSALPGPLLPPRPRGMPPTAESSKWCAPPIPSIREKQNNLRRFFPVAPFAPTANRGHADHGCRGPAGEQQSHVAATTLPLFRLATGRRRDLAPLVAQVDAVELEAAGDDV